MPCCGRTPFEVPRTDRIAEDPSLVTCAAEKPPPVLTQEQADAAYDWADNFMRDHMRTPDPDPSGDTGKEAGDGA